MCTQTEVVSYTSSHLVEAELAVNFDHGQLQVSRLPDDLFSEELVAGKEIRQSLRWFTRLPRDLPGEASSIEGDTPELGSRNKPDGLIWTTQQRRN